MKISIELIARELSLSLPSVSVRSSGRREQDMLFHHAALLEGAPFLEEGCVYVTDGAAGLTGERIRELADAGCALAAAGPLPDLCAGSSLPAVSCEAAGGGNGPGAAELLRALLGVFARFDAWLAGLYECSGPEDIQKILDLSLPVFHRPLHFFEDSLIQDTASAGVSTPTESGSRTVDYRVMSQHFNDPFSKESMHYKSAFIYPNAAVNDDMLCYNIFNSSRFTARVYTGRGDVCGDYLSSDFALITILGRLLQLIYREPSANVYEANRDIIPFLEDLVSEKPVSKMIFQLTLHNRGWVNGRFSVIYLCANRSGTLYERNCAYLCHILSERYGNIVPFPYEDNIIVVHYETASRPLSGFLPILDEFADLSHVQYGISNQSDDPARLSFLLLQAKAACFHPDVELKSLTGLRFDDIADDHLLRKGLGGCPVELMIAQEILKLKRFDAENASDYAQTLKVYLYSGLNAAEAAKALFIHYGTMVYRLRRIEEIAGVDFSDFRRVVFLYESFRLLDRED